MVSQACLAAAVSLGLRRIPEIEHERDLVLTVWHDYDNNINNNTYDMMMTT